MHKWRPTYKCIYVIPEVIGNIQELEIILNRILPLRKYKNQEDILVMLGNYIDIGDESDKVIDCLLNIKNEYKDRAIFLRGEREELFLRSRNSERDFDFWTESGGIATITAYIKRAGINATPYSIKRNRLQDLIPISHFDFINNLDYQYKTDDYYFLHGGFDPSKPISENTMSNFIFDFTSSKYVKECVRLKTNPVFKDNCVFITHHNYLGNKPFIHSKYFMLGGAAPSKLVVFELNSASACAVSRKKSRIYKYDFDFYE